MKFMLTFTIPSATRDAALSRFLETGGQTPTGVTLLGRWTQLDFGAGVVLIESEAPQALAAFAHEWSDVVDLTLAPVLEDQDLAAVLQRAKQPPASAAAHAAEVPPETYPEDAPVTSETTLRTTKPPGEALV